METRIPVAIFVDTYSPGGTQRQMIELIERLDRRQFRVHPVCFHRTGEWFERVAGFDEPVAVFPIHGFCRTATVHQLRAFARWCRTSQIAVLQTCELYSNIFGLVGGALASVPVRIGSRRGMVETRAQQRVQRAAYAAAHRVVANSQAAASRLRHEGVPDRKIDVFYNGIDLSAFPAPRRRGGRARIALVACLREEKRIDVLIAAAPRVLARHPSAEFWVVGNGSCREQLVALAQQSGVSERFRFLGHRDDVPALLADADVFVLPSRSEAFPNAVMEAMAAGLPVVATAVGGIPELVADGHTGRLVPTGDPEALALALIELLDEPRRAAQLGLAARQRVEQMFSFDRMVDQFANLYLGQLQVRARAAPRKVA